MQCINVINGAISKSHAWRASDYSVRRVERVVGVEDGHVIDLGDRAFQV